MICTLIWGGGGDIRCRGMSHSAEGVSCMRGGYVGGVGGLRACRGGVKWTFIDQHSGNVGQCLMEKGAKTWLQTHHQTPTTGSR